MKAVEHLVEWDSVFLRISGRKVQKAISELLRKEPSQVSDISLEFLEGKILVSARIQKGVSIPVKCTISRITAVGKKLEAVVENVSAFGVLPIPRFLFSMPSLKGLPQGITFDPETLTVFVNLQRFLPPFIDLNIESIRIIPGGVAVHLGAGGADIPAERM